MIRLRAMPSCLARSRSKAVLAAPATGAAVNLTKKIPPRTPNPDFPVRVITRTERIEPLGASVTGDNFSLFGICEGDDEFLLFIDAVFRRWHFLPSRWLRLLVWQLQSRYSFP